MVFMCVICMIKQPPLIPLSEEHRQLLQVIVSPVINTMELKGYQWLHCVDCKVLMQSVHNFQQTALKGVKAFKYLLSKHNKEPAAKQSLSFKPILEAKPEPITIKTEPGIDPSSTNQEFHSVLAPEQANPLSDEISVKIERDVTIEPDNSDSTMSCDKVSDPTMSCDRVSDPAMKCGSTEPLEESGSASSLNIKHNIVPQSASNSQVRVYSKKPEPKTQMSKVVTQSPQPARKVQSARIAPSTTVSTTMIVTTKEMIAENAAKVVPKGDSFEEFEMARHSVWKDRQKKKRVSCPHCNKSLKDKRGLLLHTSVIHGDGEPVACKTCGKVFRNDIVLKYHNWSKHIKVTNKVDELNPDWYCKQCEVQCYNLSAFKQHLLGLKHTPREQYAFVCETCSRRFPSKRRLQSHINIVHLNMRQHKCSTCGKQYATRAYLRGHIATAHEHAPKRRPHVCHLCGKAFTVAKSLTEHLLSHQGIRPFQCKLCPATFSYSAALYTHNRLKHLKIKGKKKKTGKEEEKVEKGVEGENEAEKGGESIDIDQFFNETV
ncbi:zinc finger protein 2-like isoform X2 [Cydia splendana]|uniref:zinc finger protein 2-like isoform X2 n=1 Tax=Cydia splendana TaxID=1100963 RepID=UPI0028F493EF